MKKKTRKSSKPAVARRAKQPLFSRIKRADKKLIVICALCAGLMTLLYWAGGAKSMFIFPTLICMALAMRKMRKSNKGYFTQGIRALPLRK